MKKIILFLGWLMLASAVLAQSAFEGFYGQIGAGYENNRIPGQSFNWDSGSGNSAVSSPSVNSGGGQLNLGLGYNASISNDLLLGLGAEYSTLSSTFSSGQIAGVGCSGSCGGGQKYRASNRHSIFLAPSYVINNDGLAYVKVGYSNEKLQSNFNNASFGSGRVKGYVLGLGYRQVLQGGLYGFGEVNYYRYSAISLNNTVDGIVSGNNPNPSAYNFIAGLGYRF